MPATTKTNSAVTLEQLKAREDVRAFIARADHNMELIGYTEHGFRHADIVAARASRILAALCHDPRQAELAAIAGYLHDVGNVASRLSHPQIGAAIAYQVLHEMGMPPEELAEVLAGVANHEEDFGDPFGPVASAVIIADKSDVDRSRVRRSVPESQHDAHDRINYAAIQNALEVDADERVIALKLSIATEIGSIMAYFELFLSRMVISRRAAEMLGCKFALVINDTRLA